MIPRFEYYTAQSVEQALTLLGQHEDAIIVAGCTNVLVDARGGRRIPSAVVDIGRLADLRYARRENGLVRLGARTTLSECAKSPFVSEQSPLLKMMAAQFAGPLVRNRATLAGNLAYASPAADSAPPLLALGAGLTLTSSQGQRLMPVADFILGPRQTALKPGELITEISFPAASGAVKSGYFKFAMRNAMAISVVSGAIVLRMDGSKIREAALALGAVAPRPYRVAEAEKMLENQAPTDALLREVARVAAASTTPISDIRASAEYRREMTLVMTRRMIEQALRG